MDAKSEISDEHVSDEEYFQHQREMLTNRLYRALPAGGAPSPTRGLVKTAELARQPPAGTAGMQRDGRVEIGGLAAAARGAPRKLIAPLASKSATRGSQLGRPGGTSHPALLAVRRKTRPSDRAPTPRAAHRDDPASGREGALRDTDSKTEGLGLDVNGSDLAARANAMSADDDSDFIRSLSLSRAQKATLRRGRFLYLTYHDQHSPCFYELRVAADRVLVNSTYFTISGHGVSCFTGSDSEFVPLLQYERGYYLFHLVRRISVFKHYHLWKTYSAWRRYVRRHKETLAKRQLQDSLFLLSPRLASTMHSIQQLCLQLRAQGLFEILPDITYSLHAFRVAQADYGHRVAARLDGFSTTVAEFLRQACDAVLERFVDSKGIKAENKMTFMERAALRTKCRKLCRFIRLVDYVARFMLVGMAHDSVRHLSGLVCRQPLVQHAALLEVQLTFTDDARVEVKPGPDAVAKEFGIIIENAVQRLTGSRQFVNHPSLVMFARIAEQEVQPEDEQVDLHQAIMANPEFMALLRDIKGGIDAAFEEVLGYARTFDKYKEQYLRAQKELAAVRACTHEVGVEEIEDAITLFKKHQQSFDAMPVTQVISIVRVNSNKFKTAVLPFPTMCMQLVRSKLPTMIMELAELLLDDISKRMTVLRSNPISVEDFVLKLRMMVATEEASGSMRDKTDKLHRFYNVMALEEWLDEDDGKIAATLSTLEKSLSDLTAAMQTVDEAAPAQTEHFVSQVSAAIPRLQERTTLLRERLEDSTLDDPTGSCDDATAHLQRLGQEASALKAQAEQYRQYQMQLRQPVTEFTDLEDACMEVDIRSKVWVGIRTWTHLTETWKSAAMDEIDPQELNRQVKAYSTTVVKAMRVIPESRIVLALKVAVDDFKRLLPIIMDLRSPALLPRHWREISTLLACELDAHSTYSLGELIRMNVMQHQEGVADITNKAVQEAALMDLFNTKVMALWKELDLPVLPYKNSKDVYMLGALDDMLAALDDSFITLNTILGSRYCQDIRAEVEKTLRKLQVLSGTLEEWTKCQRQWMYLEPIFAAPDIQRQLPNESKQFSEVDKSWRAIMKRTRENPLAMRAGTFMGLRETLQTHNEVLDRIHKSLEDYLETKRQAFPRFYFLSNDELLEILAQSRDPQAVQPHLRKCFDQLYRLQYGEGAGSTDVLAMLSPEGERVPLPRNLKARGGVEEWLNGVLAGMQKSLHRLMKDGLADRAVRPRAEWVLEHPGQVVATAAQVHWTGQTERALASASAPNELRQWLTVLVEQLSELTGMVRSNLSALQRRVVVALITTDVHARDIVEALVDDNVCSADSFSWLMQLRYYWDAEADSCVIRQSNSSIKYGFEYQGATTRLVITPLTDRCWMTITGALHLKLGANPAGPAGTGKTESSKDLAKAVGIFCVVFNCSDQIDYRMIGKLFSGLAQCGCWTCLDEFNRIDIEVLSVVAQQLLTLRQGMQSTEETVMFDGTLIPIHDHMVIVTMNPGYAGRTELPDNLKTFFRPVAMMVPDYALIAEIMLFAEGFEESKVLSRKMVRLYKLSSEQLSQQHHYDYGLRAVKSVLVMAGALRRAEPGLPEAVVLIRAMRDSNVPKFLADDLPLFHAIVADLFPDQDVPTNDNALLESRLRDQLGVKHLQPNEAFLRKAVQLYETLKVRFGAVLVGPTGGGKSTCYRTLAAALSALQGRVPPLPLCQQVEMQLLNPKCITMGELYGEFNELTQEWRDGLASSIIRSFVASDAPSLKWTVFDGPIDALWIENMNTVLDDNQTLCLANGERIKLNADMRMLFEVEDLAEASPATVSRLGVVYMTPQDLGWQPLVQSWMQQAMKDMLLPEVYAYLERIMERCVEACLMVHRKQGTEYEHTVDSQLVQAACFTFQALFQLINLDMAPMPLEKVQRSIEYLVAFSLTWAVGGSLATGHEAFSDCIVGLFPELGFGSHGAFDVVPRIKNAGPTLWHMLGSNTPGEAPAHAGAGSKQPLMLEELATWASLVPAFQYSSSISFFELFVPTQDTVRFSFLARCALRHRRHAFMTGVTGVGKTVIMQQLLHVMQDAGELVPVHLTLSARTSSNDVQSALEDKLERKRQNLLGAPGDRPAVVYVDDVNMPAKEQYGAQPPIELLRQVIDSGGFYDRGKLYWKAIKDPVVAASAAPPGGGRSHLTPRLTRHFQTLAMPAPSEAVLQRIFGAILGGFFGAHAFSEDVCKMAGAFVNSTIDVYSSMCVNMKPTPSKTHYTFNLRDVAKVFQGMLMVSPRVVSHPAVMVRLWMHECMRVFQDRLATEEDRVWFAEELAEVYGRRLSFLADFRTHGADEGGEAVMTDVVFCHFVRPADDDGAVYAEAGSERKLKTALDNALEDYNMSTSSPMRLVFFQAAISHVTRVSRVLMQPRGHALLVGVGGSGKQSLAKVACAVTGTTCSQLELTKGYGPVEFRDDLKALMQRAGVEGARTALLLSDTQIVHESFLEDINNLLNTGEVPRLFEPDELTKLVESMRPAARQQGLAESRDVCLRLFNERARNNLHVILCMSPAGDSLRLRCRQFPSLINCTTIDWYSRWPRAALLSVAENMLEDLEVGGDEPELQRLALAQLCSDVHLFVAGYCEQYFADLRRHVYISPKSFLDLIALLKHMLERKRAEVYGSLQRLSQGVEKLVHTNDMVATLQQELTAVAPVLEAKARETEALLGQVRVEQAEAQIIKDRIADEEHLVQEQAREVAEVQAEAQRDLDAAMPALNEALSALDRLDKKDITEVKSFTKPPPAVKSVMEAVCVMLGEKPDWESAKRLLSNPAFIKMLQSYDRDNISPALLRKLRGYVDNPLLEITTVERVSKACTTIAMWLHALDVYCRVASEVAPKRDRLAALNERLSDANATLSAKQAQLQQILDKVGALQGTCDETVRERDRLLQEQELTRERLNRAEKLTTGLVGEQARWRESIHQLRAQVGTVLGDSFLSAACLSYVGPFTTQYRQRMVAEWSAACAAVSISCSPAYSLATCLSNPVQLREWQINGLPTDELSAENATLVAQSRRWPLMVDPQEQAKRWVKNSYGKLQLKTVRMNQPDLLRVCEMSMRLGSPLLIEDIGERLEAVLQPLLQQAVFQQGGRTLIRLGDTDVDYADSFRLFMTTKLPNPHYLPEVCIQVCLINFTVTQAGLEEQLLGDVVRCEKPEVEARKTKLLLSMASDRKQLRELEQRMLERLSASTGNILDDEALARTLDDSKVIAAAVSSRLEESVHTEEEINAIRDQYRAVASRGSILYFVVASLGNVEPMYQYSLSYFIRLFNLCITLAPKAADVPARVANIIQHATATVFATVGRGLFAAHKLMFAILLSVRIQLHERLIHADEWGLLLRGPALINADGAPPRPPLPELTESGWRMVGAMDQQLSLRSRNQGGGTGSTTVDDAAEGRPAAGAEGSLAAHMAQQASEWAQWLKQEHPMEHEPPLTTLSVMQRVLLLRAFSEEKLVSGLSWMVQQHLGREFVEPMAVSMSDVFPSTDCRTPVVFILSTGVDPTAMLLAFAKLQHMLDQLQIVSLGQGQGPKAEAAIRKAQAAGGWVLLQNCHLAKSWMPRLEEIVDSMAHGRAGGVMPEFRLFLTSMPTSDFPVTVLQNGIKLTTEPPRGIKANMARSLRNIGDWVDYEGCRQPLPWKRLCYGLSFFHAVMQERRKYGALGFNIRYEFSDSDLETAVLVLRMLLDAQEGVPWHALQYVTGQIVYGGRVTDDWDQRCLQSVLARVYTPQVLDADYSLTAAGEPYRLPPSGPLASVAEFVDAMPRQDSPQVFGMHSNADIAYRKREALTLLHCCIALEPRGVASLSGQSADTVVANLAALIAESSPAELSTDEACAAALAHPAGYMDSLVVVLLQEMERFNVLLGVMSRTLVDLRRAIKGEVLMSDELDEMYQAFLINKVPASWAKVAYPSLKPLSSWVQDLQQRVQFIRGWLQNGAPSTYWLSGFVFPQGFLTGVLQNYARKHRVPVDALNFCFRISRAAAPVDVKRVGVVAEDGVLISGLFLEGARWPLGGDGLRDAKPGQMHCPMPIIHFLPKDGGSEEPPDVYACPLYKTSVRAGVLSTTGMSTNFVLAVHLLTSQPKDYWVLQGTALLCQLDS